MENNLFRKKSLDHISSPEEMHDYMRVTSPRVWMLLSAILLLLGGFVFFIATANMESTYALKAENIQGFVSSVIPAADMDVVKLHMPIRMSGLKGEVSDMLLGPNLQLTIKLDSGEPLKDGFSTLVFEPDPDLPEDFEGDIPLNIRSGLVTSISFYNDVDTIRSRDWRVRVDGDLGTITDASVIDMCMVFFAFEGDGFTMPDGVYDLEIITESTTPISFLIN